MPLGCGLQPPFSFFEELRDQSCLAKLAKPFDLCDHSLKEQVNKGIIEIDVSTFPRRLSSPQNS
jgi:hypothetical protein